MKAKVTRELLKMIKRRKMYMGKPKKVNGDVVHISGDPDFVKRNPTIKQGQKRVRDINEEIKKVNAYKNDPERKKRREQLNKAMQDAYKKGWISD